jgi:hypothetical protein
MTARTLLAGWFSFEGMGATAGDLLARDVARSWLVDAHRVVDVALAPPFEGGVRWDNADPAAYDEVVFVCGPFGNGPPIVEFLDRFRERRLVGLDLTMLDPLEEWNPFALLLERDSSRTSRPDLVFAASRESVPVVGLVLMHEQPEYGERDVARTANEKLEAIARECVCARVRIDTRLDADGNELRTPVEVASMIARCDVVLTSRLHGLVLAMHTGVPAVALDPVAGGAKITRQAGTLGWPWCFPFDVTLDALRDAYKRCLEPEARVESQRVADAARRRLVAVRSQFLAELGPVGA